MPTLKSHKGLAKRIKVTARGKVKFSRVGSGHLLSHKSGDKRRRLRQRSVAAKGDMKRLGAMLHRPLTPRD
ncbi:50S ribosomal protein L35 [Phycisphaerales bacterium AB-hyl4]|uniref:Large ribosomal subunit protein bL35 n=1 Tax=Natronomicrosphaera hydrolytica TaxID=3242702 RepID=A0ABV4U1C9_9BACT